MWFYFGSWLDSSVDSAIPMFYLSYSSSIASSLKWNFLTCSVYRKILGIVNSRERQEPLGLHLIFSSYILNSLSSPQSFCICAWPHLVLLFPSPFLNTYLVLSSAFHFLYILYSFECCENTRCFLLALSPISFQTRD